MKIQPVMPIMQQNRANFAYSNSIKTAPLQTDTVNFKGTISSSLIFVVIKEGYKGLKDNTQKAKFKNEIAQKMSAPDVSDNARQLVDVLFALAKTKGKDEPFNMLYGLKDKYNFYKTLKELRSEAIGKLFPLIPVMKNDINSGNAAKTAMLGSMIDSGEYLESPYIYSAYKSLFNASDKESLILKAMRDKNVWREINETYVLPEAKERAENSYQRTEDKSDSDSFFHFLKIMFYDLPKDMINEKKHVKNEIGNFIPEVQKKYSIKRAIINTTLIHSLDIRKHQDFFSAYGDIIKSQSQIAYQNIAKMLKENLESKSEYNMLYKKYSECLKELSVPEEHLSISYLKEVSEYLKNDIKTLSKEFNISPTYCEDMLKDFELISKSSTLKINNIKPLFEKRIEEKLLSNDKMIQDSAGTLVYLSGHADELKYLLDSKKLSDARSILDSKMKEHSSIYGCKEPYIPTLEELKKAEEERAEEYRNSESSFSDDDIDMMEAHARINYM